MKKGRKCPIPQIRANLPLRNFVKTLLFLTGVAPGVVGYERLEMIVGVMVGKPYPLLPYHDAFQGAAVAVPVSLGDKMTDQFDSELRDLKAVPPPTTGRPLRG